MTRTPDPEPREPSPPRYSLLGKASGRPRPLEEAVRLIQAGIRAG